MSNRLDLFVLIPTVGKYPIDTIPVIGLVITSNKFISR